MNSIFEGLAQVAIQGERVLRFVDYSKNQATYEVIGFENQKVTLIDYRPKGLLAIQSLLENGDLYIFAPIFNHPAMVKIKQDETEEVFIELTETEDCPSYVLWIAIGLGNTIPIYNYVYENIVPLKEENKFGLIAVYQSSSSIRPALSSWDLASATLSSSSVT